MNIKLGHIIIVSALLSVVSLAAQSQKITPRIDTLKTNSNYMSLVDSCNTLSEREGTLTDELNSLRAQYEADHDNAEKYSDRITTLELQIFDVQSLLPELEERIFTIEQDYLVRHPEEAVKDVSEISTQDVAEDKILNNSMGEDLPNLVYNKFFEDNLSADGYAELVAAQETERTVETYARIYRHNHESLQSMIDTMYYAAVSVAAADSVWNSIARLKAMNAMIADSINTKWNGMFDMKTYSYNYILDKFGKQSMLQESNAKIDEFHNKAAGLTGVYDNDDLAAYTYAKPLLLELELKMAEALSLYAATDSLQRVIATYDQRYLLPKLNDMERAEWQFSDIDVVSPAIYNSKNPIPQCKVPESGVVLRILLGNYSSPAQPSVFKGVAPLCVERKADRRYYYYAGTFPTYNSTSSAMKRLVKLGFRQPMVVAWSDGEYGDVALKPDAKKIIASYRIEIVGTGLNQDVRDYIQNHAPDKEISRVATDNNKYLFIVGLFEDKALAGSISENIKYIDNNLSVKVVGIEK